MSYLEFNGAINLPNMFYSGGELIYLRGSQNQ